MRIIEANNRRALERALSREQVDNRAFERRVAGIVDRVRRGGDAALLRFARRFDGVSPPLEISPNQMRAAA